MVDSMRQVRRRTGPPPRHALASAQPADRTATVGVMLVLLLVSAFVAGTTATFAGNTSNNNTFQTSKLVSPDNDLANVSLEGNDVNLAWGEINEADQQDTGYRLSRSDTNLPTAADGGTPGCGSATWNAASRIAYRLASVITYTHDNSMLGSPPGRWYCYRIETVAPCCTPEPVLGDPAAEKMWYVEDDSGKPTYQFQAGMVVRSVMFTGNGTNTINAGDAIKFTFNQPVDVTDNAANLPATGNLLCVDAGAEILRIGAVGGCNEGLGGGITEVSIGHMQFEAGTWGSPNRQWPLTMGWAATTGAVPDTTAPYSCSPNCTVLTATVGVGSTKNEPNLSVEFLPTQKATPPIRSYWDADGDNSAITARLTLCHADTTAIPNSECRPVLTGAGAW